MGLGLRVKHGMMIKFDGMMIKCLYLNNVKTLKRERERERDHSRRSGK